MKMFFSFFFCLQLFSITTAQSGLLGAWQRKVDAQTTAVAIVADKYFSVSYFKSNEFVATQGGSWIAEGTGLSLTLEWDSQDPNNVGSSVNLAYSLDGDRMTVDGESWTRVDDGTPGDLADAWLMTGRKRDGVGEMQIREMGPRKTMKILSGTRFQWIAYDTEKKSFSGTGGGTYTTVDGTYTENIDFFSRDNSRVGASLPFHYELVDNAWHHSGKSSKGDPIYEVWSRRSGLE
jgi:hypothetical protein